VSSTGVAEGDRAPSFVLRDQDGKELRSDSLRGTPYVLYFYPKDDTPGCTTEACGFRDNARGFGKSKVRVLGVSPDSEASHARFAKKYGLPFTLLSDPEKELAEAYGVWVEKQNYGRKYMGIQRSTFLVDGKGVVKKAYRGVRVPGHVEAVLEASSEL
jgi:peroxiredoxin Q/BCP